jgi:DNA invertase Pin-like site-specific DNA recombinase
MAANRNANVTIIPARQRVGNRKRDEERPKLRVAAYCRVSTDSDEQATSYEAQIEHYTAYIQKNPEWELAGIFADDGLSGTDTRKRGQFNLLIEECMAGKIDMIITKSISRFARNTLDCLKYIRQLKEQNIPVFFEKENINTMDSKGEVLLTIMASLAQQESQSLSQNVKLGLQYRYQQGLVQVNHNRFLGYTKDEDGRLIIEPQEAEIVKRIYREYLEGASLQQIDQGLEVDGILTAANKKRWWPETLRKILQNEKYIGDALLQKTYTVDFLSKKRVKNNGIVPQYYMEGSHEAIIPRDLYMQVQEEMVRRANLHSGAKRKKRVYSSKYALSSIVYCPRCGEIYRRIAWNNRGKHSIVWRCCTRVEHGPTACDAPTIQENDLQSAVAKAIHEVLGEKDAVIPILEMNIVEVLSNDSSSEVSEIDRQLGELQQELLRLVNTKSDYTDVADEIYRLREERQAILVQDAECDGKRQRIEEMKAFLEEQADIPTEYDEQLVRRLIEKVTVFDEKITVRFKSGVEINVEK